MVQQCAPAKPVAHGFACDDQDLRLLLLGNSHARDPVPVLHLCGKIIERPRDGRRRAGSHPPCRPGRFCGGDHNWLKNLSQSVLYWSAVGLLGVDNVRYPARLAGTLDGAPGGSARPLKLRRLPVSAGHLSPFQLIHLGTSAHFPLTLSPFNLPPFPLSCWHVC